MLDEILILPEMDSLLKMVARTSLTMAFYAETLAFKIRKQWRYQRFDLFYCGWAQTDIHFKPKVTNLRGGLAKNLAMQNDH